MFIKNKTTPENREFWEHVENVARITPGRIIEVPSHLQTRLITKRERLQEELTNLYLSIGQDHVEFVKHGTAEARSSRNYLTTEVQKVQDQIAAIGITLLTIDSMGGF
jgi:hypothetical protein